MKKLFIVSLIAMVAVSSYMLFDIYRYRAVKDDFLIENPDCMIISINPYGDAKKKLYYWIRYKRKGDSRILEIKWFYQENIEDGSWDKLEKDKGIENIE